jgi:hypothetical protein
MVFKNSVRTAKKTPSFTITKINWLTLFKEIIAVYSENHTKPINTKRSFADYKSSLYIIYHTEHYSIKFFSSSRHVPSFIYVNIYLFICGLFNDAASRSS